jgi:hypothetical protein
MLPFPLGSWFGWEEKTNRSLESKWNVIECSFLWNIHFSSEKCDWIKKEVYKVKPALKD